MADSFLRTINPIQKGISADGRVLQVNSGDLGNADTSYLYFLLGAAGFDAFSIQHTIGAATTLTYEGSNSDLRFADAADEMILATNDRTFGGAGNWEAVGDAVVAVGAGVLGVTVGAANTGAKLTQEFFKNAIDSRSPELRKGFLQNHDYTLLVTIGAISAGTVTIKAGTQVIATAVAAGVAQTFTIHASQHRADISFLGTNASATFSIDDISIKPVAAVWRDIMDLLTDSLFVSFTATGSLTIKESIPWARMRAKRVTTNATNSIDLIMQRMKL